MRSLTALLTLALLACGNDDDGGAPPGSDPESQAAAAARGGDVRASGPWSDAPPPADIQDRVRADTAWRSTVTFDSTPLTRPRPGLGSAEGGGPDGEPTDTVEGRPETLHVQILLDRAGFSPGIIDGKDGQNTEKALYWFQRREGLPATGRPDAATERALRRVASATRDLVVRRALTADDVAGPFVRIPSDIYAKAKLERLAYESLTEKLSERFHVAPALLRDLNPGVDLDGLQAGDSLVVPNLEGGRRQATAPVARLVISDGGHYLHALDAEGRILYHFPATLGSSYDPSPQGEYSVESITLDPWWHYQPELLADVPDDRPDAHIPPGPNSAVGLVWMALSKPHYGIHGTSAPETIGYATSAGCVRLTNWDVLFLADRIEAGIPVSFRDTGPRVADGEG